MTPVLAPPAPSTQTPWHPTTAPLPLINLFGISGLGAIIAIHTTELSGKIEETAYLGLGYVLLIAASITSIVMLGQRDRRGWVVAGATALATIIGFVLTRTTGLPGASGDIGNWRETIAVWSLLAEVLVAALAAVALSARRRPRVSGRTSSTERGTAAFDHPASEYGPRDRADLHRGRRLTVSRTPARAL